MTRLPSYRIAQGSSLPPQGWRKQADRVFGCSREPGRPSTAVTTAAATAGDTVGYEIRRVAGDVEDLARDTPGCGRKLNSPADQIGADVSAKYRVDSGGVESP